MRSLPVYFFLSTCVLLVFSRSAAPVDCHTEIHKFVKDPVTLLIDERIEAIRLLIKKGASKRKVDAAIRKLYRDAGDDYALVTDAMTAELVKGSETLKKHLAENPASIEARTYDYIYIGAGIHTAIVKSAFQSQLGKGIADVKVLTVEATKDISVFGRSGKTFRGNTQEHEKISVKDEAGLTREQLIEASKNFQPGASIQVADVAKEKVPVADQLQAPAVTSHYRDKSDFLFDSTAESIREIDSPTGKLVEVKTRDGLTLYARHGVVLGSGLGEEKLPTRDPESVAYIKGQEGSPNQKVFFVEDLLHQMRKEAQASEDILKKFNGGRVIIAGGGHGGAIGIEAIEGQAPSPIYRFSDKSSTPASYLWVNLEANTGDEFKKIIGGGDRYFPIAPLIDSGKIKTNQYYIHEILPSADGKRVRVSFTDKVTRQPVLDSRGQVLYEEGDFVIYGTGYSSPFEKLLPAFRDATGKLAFEPVLGKIKPNDKRLFTQTPVAVATNLLGPDGKPTKVFAVGPAAGQIAHPKDPGGTTSVTINVFASRSEALGKKMARDHRKKKK